MMERQRAIRLARKWSSGGVCSLREGEAAEYHKMCLDALTAQEDFDRMGETLTKKMREVEATLARLNTRTENEPLTQEELRGMVGEWVWVVVDYQHDDQRYQCDGWALVSTPAIVAYLEQLLPIDFYGKKFLAYRHKLEVTE